MDNIIKVLVVDDSAHNRRVLTGMLASSPNVKVVGTAIDGEDAIKKALTLKPDIITLDLEMPRMDGFAFLRFMMSRFPTPTIVVSSRNGDKDVFKALELGAVDFIAKPGIAISGELVKIQDELLRKLGMAGNIRMDKVKAAQVNHVEKSVVKSTANVRPMIEFPLVAIGSSTGGPSALQCVLSMIPSDIPAAVAISQHMPAGFTRTFADRLNKLFSLNVKEAEDGDTVRPGSVLIAPGGFHLGFAKSGSSIVAKLLVGEESDKYVPSVNRMLFSAAELFGERTIGVVMTGMGNDGKEGIVRIKKAGGQTIAQSEETSVIFGMPKEAIMTGMVDRVLPLEGIAEGIVSMCKNTMSSGNTSSRY